MSPIQGRDAIEAGFTPSITPPTAADGGPVLPPAPIKLPVIQPVSLCELGPCVNFHRLAQKLDAERPIDGSETPIYITESRTCYPSPGIEYDLTGEPVKECSRWTPGSPLMRTHEINVRNEFRNLHSDLWADYLESWRPHASDIEAAAVGAVDTFAAFAGDPGADS